MKTFTIVLLTLLALLAGYKLVKGQSVITSAPFQMEVQGLHTVCTLNASGLTQYCFASDGLWISIAGAPYAQLGGVTSVNGQTGVVTITLNVQ
jgi:hypothetical protein